jgi:alkylhydroperoxidase family enzyme
MHGVAAPEATEWLECIVSPAPVPRQLTTDVKRVLGFAPGWLNRLAPLPWLAHAAAGFAARRVAHAPLPLCEQISLIVSQDNSCRYCYGVQRAFFRVLGYTDGYLARLERDLDVPDVSPRNRAALEFARRISRGNPRPTASDTAELQRLGFERTAVAEFAFVAAAVLFMNRLATLLALPPEALESMVQSRLFWLVRPLIAWQARPRLLPPASLPQPNVGPCAAVVTALDGSPAASLVRRVVDDALGSSVLPARTKALMIAVIARALGCRQGEADARALLVNADLGSADVDDILANLGSPRLDAREARLVPFARETVRYQVGAIQRRMQVVSQGMSGEELLETAGILSLANAVCRLSVLLDAC